MNGFNNYGYPTGGYPTGGYYYQEAPKLSMTQGITPEEMKTLSTKSSGFNLNIPEEEMLRSFCTHRYENRSALTQDEEGNFTCSICGTKFKGFDGTVSDARQVATQMVDLMETVKSRALTLPAKTIRDVNQIIPIIKRIPDLYDQALNDFKRSFGNDNSGYYYGQDANAFNAYQNMVNPMAGNGYYDPAMSQPVFGAQPQAYGTPFGGQPVMPQQYPQTGFPQQGYPYPTQQPQGYPQQVNPFTGAPQQNNQQQFTGQAPQQAPVQTTADNKQPETVTVSKTLTD